MKISMLFAILGVLFFVFFGIMHEQVHVAIYESYGIPSHIEYFSHFPDFVTVADTPCEYDTCVLAHNINEAVGYHAMVFYALIFIGLLFIMSILEDNRGKK